MALPLVAVIAPIPIILFISETIWPKKGLEFPRELHAVFRGFSPRFAYELMEDESRMFAHEPIRVRVESTPPSTKAAPGGQAALTTGEAAGQNGETPSADDSTPES
jgi:hypothetical protein